MPTAALPSLVMAPNEFGRPWTAPPGMAADRLKILRDAWSKTLKDPELASRGEKAHLAGGSRWAAKRSRAGERGHRPAAGSHRQIEKTLSGIEWLKTGVLEYWSEWSNGSSIDGLQSFVWLTLPVLFHATVQLHRSR